MFELIGVPAGLCGLWWLALDKRSGIAASLTLIGIVCLIGSEAAGSQSSCNAPGRYQAMAEGADCFNPPVFRAKRPSCWSIRAAIHQYGEAAVEQMARAKGATDADIARVRAACQ